MQGVKNCIMYNVYVHIRAYNTLVSWNKYHLHTLLLSYSYNLERTIFVTTFFLEKKQAKHLDLSFEKSAFLLKLAIYQVNLVLGSIKFIFKHWDSQFLHYFITFQQFSRDSKVLKLIRFTWKCSLSFHNN